MSKAKAENSRRPAVEDGRVVSRFRSWSGYDDGEKNRPDERTRGLRGMFSSWKCSGISRFMAKLKCFNHYGNEEQNMA